LPYKAATDCVAHDDYLTKLSINYKQLVRQANSKKNPMQLQQQQQVGGPAAPKHPGHIVGGGGHNSSAKGASSFLRVGDRASLAAVSAHAFGATPNGLLPAVPPRARRQCRWNASVLQCGCWCWKGGLGVPGFFVALVLSASSSSTSASSSSTSASSR
jgi:hypothetical protein